jgi:MMPL family
MPLRQAVTRALEHTGSTVTSAGLVLAGTFGVFALVVGGQWLGRLGPPAGYRGGADRAVRCRADR